MPTDKFTGGAGSNSGTWTVPAGVTSVTIECYGGGGGGGAGNGTSAGGGGGGGGYSSLTVSVSPGNAIAWTAGSYGAGGTSPSGPGSDASASSCSTYSLNAQGGNGGNGPPTPTGGGGGSATGGTVNSTGVTGGTGSGASPGLGGEAGNIDSDHDGKGADGNLNSANNGNPGAVAFTYSAATSAVAGFFPLYINTGCAAGPRPSGDMAQYPSGHWFNFIGGSGNYWSNVNTDPNWQVTDNDYITTVQSGFIDRTNKIYYTSFNATSGFFDIKYYDINAASGGTFVQNTSATNLLWHTKECSIFDLEGSSNNLVSRMEGGYQSPKTVIPAFTSFFPTYTAFDIVYDRKNKKILYIFAVSGNINIYTSNPDGTSLILILSIPESNVDSIKANIDYRSNKLQILFHTSTGLGATRYQIIWMDLTSLATTFFTASNTGSVNSLADFSYDNKNSNYYVDYFTFTGTYNSEYISSGNFALGNPATSLPFNDFNMKVDGWRQNVYFTSGTTLRQSSVSGTSITTKLTDTNGISCLSFDGPEYYSNIDFALDQLPPGFGTTSVLQQVTNAYVTLTAQENFDFSNVYAKVIKRDQTVLWENYPESCAQFPQASGKIKLDIGLTGSVVNTNFNTLNDWNNSLLRLEIFSLNDNQPSGNFRIYNVQFNAFCSGTVPVGTSVTGSFPLFCKGVGATSGSFPLYIPGQTSNAMFPLFIDGGALASGTFPLYISGAFPNATLPLCMLGPQVSSGNTSLPLFTYSLSSTRSGLFNDFNLYINGDQSSNSSVPLYILNGEGKFSSGNIPLSLTGSVGSVNQSLNLYINSPYSASGFPLYTFGQGSGTLGPLGPYGGVPYAQTIPLYIKRPNIVGVLPLVLFNQEKNNTLNLYTTGANPASGSLSLAVPNVFGSGTNSMNLYVSGW